MRLITHIIVHCSDSYWGNANAIRGWHKARGWRDIGYHYVILNGRPTHSHSQSDSLIASLNGSIECGRPLNSDPYLDGKEIGADTLGFNKKSIGICLIGKDQFFVEQRVALHKLLRDLCQKYSIPTHQIIGHNETASGKRAGKTCPNLDMTQLRNDLNLWIETCPSKGESQ